MRPLLHHIPLSYSSSSGRDFFMPAEKFISVRTPTRKIHSGGFHPDGHFYGNTLATLFPLSLAINTLRFVPSQYFRKTGIKREHFGNTLGTLWEQKHRFCATSAQKNLKDPLTTYYLPLTTNHKMTILLENYLYHVANFISC